MLCPQHHRTLRGAWLEVVLATGPEKKRELSLNWKLGSFRAPEGHNGGEGKSRKSGQSREKEEEALVCGRSQTTLRLFLALQKNPALGTPSTRRGCSLGMGREAA